MAFTKSRFAPPTLESLGLKTAFLDEEKRFINELLCICYERGIQDHILEGHLAPETI